MLSEGFRLRLFRRHASPGPFASFTTFLVCFCFSRSLFRNLPRKLTRSFARNSTQARPKLHPKFFPKFVPKFAPEIFKLVFKGFEAPEICPLQIPPQISHQAFADFPTQNGRCCAEPCSTFSNVRGEGWVRSRMGQIQDGAHPLVSVRTETRTTRLRKAGKESRYKYRPVT